MTCGCDHIFGLPFLEVGLPLLRGNPYYQVASSHLPTPQILRVLNLYYPVASSHLPAPRILRVLKLYYQVTSSHLATPQILRVLKLYYHVILLPSHQFSSGHSPVTPRTKVVLPSRQFSSSSSPATPRTTVVLQSRQCSSSSSTDTPRTQLVLPTHQFSSSHSPATLRTKVVLPSRQLSFHKSRSRLHFAHSTHTISAEGCAVISQIALSPAFRALDTHDLRRGLRGNFTNRALACTSRTRHARSPQRVARTPDESRSHLHFAHSTRTISAEGRTHMGRIALSPAFRALDTHDLRRGSRAHGTNRALACISRTRHARSPQRVAFSVDAVRPTLRL